MWVECAVPKGAEMPSDRDRSPQAAKVVHDPALFRRLLRAAQAIDPALRQGTMFGCPAIYCGSKLTACVYGNRIGLKVPEAIAQRACGEGHAIPFTPYGKRPMRE